jgi:hypothetical protein
VVNGSLKAQFDGQSKIDLLDLTTFNHKEYVPHSGLQATAAASDIKQSPSTNIKQGKRGSQPRQKQQIQASQDQSPKAPVPDSLVNELGTTKAVCQFLEVISRASLDHDPD